LRRKAENEALLMVTTHDPKELQFRSVIVMAYDDTIISDAGRISEIGDMAEMEAVCESERHLLYLACTRPRTRVPR
jgi:superfamily I DNA/RNA helicase